jgi:glyoxylate reductase
MSFRIFATCDIGKEALDRLRQRGWQLEVYGQIEPPPKALILEKVRSGIDALITTLRDRIDDEVLSASAASGLKVVAQDAVGYDNIDRAAANTHKIPFSNTAEVLTDATAEFAFLLMGRPRGACGRPSAWCAKRAGPPGTRGIPGSATRSPARRWR